jgi:hypothetical protein
MLTVVEQWITDYSLASIRDIQYLFNHPGDAQTIRHLAKEEQQLAIERATALSDEALAERALGKSLYRLKIPSLVHLKGT